MKLFIAFCSYARKEKYALVQKTVNNAQGQAVFC